MTRRCWRAVLSLWPTTNLCSSVCKILRWPARWVLPLCSNHSTKLAQKLHFSFILKSVDVKLCCGLHFLNSCVLFCPPGEIQIEVWKGQGSLSACHGHSSNPSCQVCETAVIRGKSRKNVFSFFFNFSTFEHLNLFLNVLSSFVDQIQRGQ